MKTYQITGVKKILGIEKPIIVFEVQGRSKGIARTPQQAILDLQNSLLLSTAVNSVNDPAFDDALRRCVNGTVEGDIRFFKAGDEYTIEAGHPALTDSSHELFGKVKEGDTAKAKSDGAWVEGFLTVVYSQTQEMITAMSSKAAEAFTRLFANVMPAAPVQELPQGNPEDAAPKEAIEKKAA